MSNTYTRLYVHFVFAVKCRQLLIRDLLVNESIEVETPETGYLAGLTLSENLQNMFDRADFIIFLIPPDNLDEIFHYIKNWIYRFAEPAEKYVSK